jgi:putative membrane protein insertion efficiency factor
MSGGEWAVTAVVALGTVDLLASSAWVAHVAPGLTRRTDGSVRGPLVWVWTGVVLAYRAASAGRTSGVCRFEPSCSAYALGAVRAYGGVRGGALACYRLLRCQPLSKGGFDPVPERGPVSRPRFRSRRGRPATAPDPSVGTRA